MFGLTSSSSLQFKPIRHFRAPKLSLLRNSLQQGTDRMQCASMCASGAVPVTAAAAAPAVLPSLSPQQACGAKFQSQSSKKIALQDQDVHLEWTSRDHGVPVYVMLPLDSVNMDGTLNKNLSLDARFQALKRAGVEGLMTDVWWGIVEKDAPGHYNWCGYMDLFDLARKHGLKVQVVMSFHQCGGNVGDNCFIPLPRSVTDEICRNGDLVYKDKSGSRNHEYLSLGCDQLPVLEGRSPVEAYTDLMTSFRQTFQPLLGNQITEIQVGMGPAGELRYPSYPDGDGGWKYPGIGEFQCHDKYMMGSLKDCAQAAGKPEWGHTGPHDAGTYNQWPDDTGFFRHGGSWATEYGDFFLKWYSGMLIDHGDRILSAAQSVFAGTGAHISGKVPGVHWHYGTPSHAAELTAGFYSTQSRDGYLPVARMFARHGAVLNFTCLEMRDADQPPQFQCGPERLLAQVASAAHAAGARMSGENALPIYDRHGYDQIAHSVERSSICSFTLLRMSDQLFQDLNWQQFCAFVKRSQHLRSFSLKGPVVGRSLRINKLD